MSKLFDKVEILCRWILFLGFVAFVTAIVVSVCALPRTAKMMGFYWTYAPALHKDLGFRLGSPYIETGQWLSQEVEMFEAVEVGGVLYRAGVRNGDILVYSGNDFYEMLESSRGNEVTMTVVDGGDGLPLNQRPRRKIRFTVPERHGQSLP